MNQISNSLAMRDVAYHLHSHTNARVHEANGPVTIIVPSPAALIAAAASWATTMAPMTSTA